VSGATPARSLVGIPQQKSSATKTATSAHQKGEPGWVCRGNNNFGAWRAKGKPRSSLCPAQVWWGREGGDGFAFYEGGEGRKIR